MKRVGHTKEFINQAILRLKENTPRIAKCLSQLSDQDIWQKPNSSSNSVGNLILHLCGNITQYIISSIGQKNDDRDRDSEFEIGGGYTKSELLNKLESVVKRAVEVIKGLSEEELLEERSVQGFRYSGIGSIIHVVEHYSYHTGQIAFWTKLLKDKDLGFYDGVDLNKRNE